MSLASNYAAAMASAEAGEPPTWSGPAGLLIASVTATGDCLLTVQGIPFPVTAAVLLEFATWVTDTYT